MANPEDACEGMGLKRASHVEEIFNSKSFIIDTNWSDGEKRLKVPVYPVNGGMNLAHDLLNLYGTHWRYTVEVEDWNAVSKDDGDTESVLENIRNGTRIGKHARYSFTQKYLDNNKSLWLFVPGTAGWEYYNDVLLPLYRNDVAGYELMKMHARNGKPA